MWPGLNESVVYNCDDMCYNFSKINIMENWVSHPADNRFIIDRSEGGNV